MVQATQARTAARTPARAEEPVWGPVDAILALVLLPVALWVGAIDLLVRAVVWVIDRY